MKIAFIIPVLSECDVEQRFNAIKTACEDSNVDFDVIYAFNEKLNNEFSKVRSVFIDQKNVRAFKVNKTVNQHKLITIAMRSCEYYDATIIYSGKETINVDVIKAFITSWKSGNKVVYLKKVYSGFKKLWLSIKNSVYWLGTKLMGVFKDMGAETDIQLLDKDVVVTINQLPEKNRHLRTLDSFIGYNIDIIKMEVDSKIKDSKYYIEKTQKYKIAGIMAWVFLGICLSLLAIGVLSVSLGWKLRLIANIFIWLGSALFGLFSLVFYTRKNLLVRVGDSEDMSDLKEIEGKMEVYNY